MVCYDINRSVPLSPQEFEKPAENQRVSLFLQNQLPLTAPPVIFKFIQVSKMHLIVFLAFYLQQGLVKYVGTGRKDPCKQGERRHVTGRETASR